jgi:hypothetical protein
LAIPQMALMATLDPRTFTGQRGFGGWPLPVYAFLFLYGFLLVSREQLEAQAEKSRWVSLGVGLLTLFGTLILWKSGGDPAYGTMRYAIQNSLWALGSWSILVALFGLARRHLGFTNQFVRYSNEAVLPFYVLHQSVIIAVGFLVVQWPVADSLKFVVIGVVSFTCILGFYEFVIRRNNLVRLLFGMKVKCRSFAATSPRRFVGKDTV